MNAEKRLEVYGFNLKKKSPLTQKALNLAARHSLDGEKDILPRLYRILHKIKLLRKSERRCIEAK